MTKLYQLSGIGTISPDIIDGYAVELERFYRELKASGQAREAAIAKSVTVLLESGEALTALENALENSRFPSVYAEIINVLFPESLGSILPPAPTVLGNVQAPVDSETRKLLNYFADYYRRKYQEMYQGKSFFEYLMDPGIISKGTTDMLRRSNNPGKTYSIPYRVAYQDAIGYNNARLLADAKRLGFTDFEGDQVQAATTQVVNTVQDQNQQVAVRTKQDVPMQPLSIQQPTLPGSRSVNELPATTTAGENKLMAFYDKNKRIIIIVVSAIVVAILGFVIFKPKKKKRSLSGVRRRRRTTARKTVTRRRRKRRTPANSTKRKTTSRRKRKRTSSKRPLRLSAPKMTVSRARPKKRKKTTSPRKKSTRRTVTKRRAA